MVVVAVREKDALHVGDGEIAALQPRPERVPGLFGQRPRIDQRDRVAKNHMNIDRPHGERGRNGKSLYEW